MTPVKITLSIVLMLTAISSLAAENPIRYGGSSTIGKLITDAAAIYGKSRFRLNTRIESAGGERCVTDGTCDIGGVAREVDEKWLEQGVVKVLIGRDAVAVIVNKENPIDGLIAGDLKAIFTGRFKDWSQLGGPHMPIRPYIVAEASATQVMFRDVILEGDDYVGVIPIAPDSRIVTQVASQRGAIGHISLSFLRHKATVKVLRVDGERASVENATYPLSRPLYLLTRADAPARVTDFIDWILTEEGQAVVRYRFMGVD